MFQLDPHQFKGWVVFQLVQIQLSQCIHTDKAIVIVRIVTDIVKMKVGSKRKTRAIQASVEVQISRLDALQVIANGKTEKSNLQSW